MAGNGLPVFPVTVVGSWPRPTYLLEALHQRQAGQISFDEFNAVADRAVLEALKYQDFTKSYIQVGRNVPGRFFSRDYRRNSGHS